MKLKIESREKEKRTLSYYDENASAFCEGTRNADMSEMRGRFLQYLKPGTLILDAGCGSGRDSKFFMESGYRVVVLDGSKEMCRQASAYLGQDTLRGHLQEVHTTDQGTFSCSGHSDDSENISRLDGQIYIFQSLYRAVF